MKRQKQYDEKQLTDVQKKIAAELIKNAFAKPRDKRTLDEIAEECGVSRRTVTRHKSDPNVVEYIDYHTEMLVDSEVAEVYAALIRSARQGNTKAIELYLKSRGKLIDKAQIEQRIEEDYPTPEERRKRLEERLAKLDEQQNNDN